MPENIFAYLILSSLRYKNYGIDNLSQFPIVIFHYSMKHKQSWGLVRNPEAQIPDGVIFRHSNSKYRYLEFECRDIVPLGLQAWGFWTDPQ